MQKKTFLLATLTALLAACSNVPKSTTADIPLVHSSLAYSLSADKDKAINIPNLGSSLSNRRNVQISHEGIDYQATKSYTSATGNDCIRFQAINTPSGVDSSNHKEKLTACKRGGSWSILSPLVASVQEQGE